MVFFTNLQADSTDVSSELTKHRTMVQLRETMAASTAAEDTTVSKAVIVGEAMVSPLQDDFALAIWDWSGIHQAEADTVEEVVVVVAMEVRYDAHTPQPNLCQNSVFWSSAGYTGWGGNNQSSYNQGGQGPA